MNELEKLDYRMDCGEKWVRLSDVAALTPSHPDTIAVLKQAREALTWLCVPEVHYDVDVRQAPNLTADAWAKADETLTAIDNLLNRLGVV